LDLKTFECENAQLDDSSHTTFTFSKGKMRHLSFMFVTDWSFKTNKSF
jgi:hypothetical protein